MAARYCAALAPANEPSLEVMSFIKRPISYTSELALMKICQIEIENFRGVAHGTVTFPDHAVLFGPNNVGKSTVVEALAACEPSAASPSWRMSARP